MIWELALDFKYPGRLGSRICVLHPQMSKRSSVSWGSRTFLKKSMGSFKPIKSRIAIPLDIISSVSEFLEVPKVFDEKPQIIDLVKVIPWKIAGKYIVMDFFVGSFFLYFRGFKVKDVQKKFKIRSIPLTRLKGL